MIFIMCVLLLIIIIVTIFKPETRKANITQACLWVTGVPEDPYRSLLLRQVIVNKTAIGSSVEGLRYVPNTGKPQRECVLLTGEEEEYFGDGNVRDFSRVA